MYYNTLKNATMQSYFSHIEVYLIIESESGIYICMQATNRKLEVYSNIKAIIKFVYEEALLETQIEIYNFLIQ